MAKSATVPRKVLFPTATELFVYLCNAPTKTGMTRELIGNFVRGSSIQRVMRHTGPGRYRVEFRCPKRLVVGIRLFEVTRDGEVRRAKPLKKPDKIPPPTYVPPVEEDPYR